MSTDEFADSETSQGPDPEVEDESGQDDEGLTDIGESSLSYFGADFDVAGLVRRLNDGDIIVPRFDPDESGGSSLEGFQRQRVWGAPRMEKFIESLLLGWPVPSIFLVIDKDQRYLVLDGQQRLTALQAFFEGRLPNGRPFILHEVAEHLKDATYDTLNAESRRRLNNTFIQATVIEPTGKDGRESVYRLFGRLNSGGVILTPQEIRVALYRGPIVDLIRELNADPNWRRLFGPPHLRLKDQELILRALAMREVAQEVHGRWDLREVTSSAYKPPMSDFLNSYLERHQDLEGLKVGELRHDFATACALLVGSVGAEGLKFAGRINAAHVDALVGVLMASVGPASPSPERIRRAVSELRESDPYSAFVTTGTSHRDNVIGRLALVSSALHILI